MNRIGPKRGMETVEIGEGGRGDSSPLMVLYEKEGGEGGGCGCEPVSS